MTFEQQLTITILDKAIIGALIAVAAFILTRKLERFKSTQALSNEYAKQRLEKVASLWEVLHAWEAEAVEYSRLVHRAIGFSGDNAPLNVVLERYVEGLTTLQDRAQKVKLDIERTQFWLGADLRDRFLRYYQAILDHIGNMRGDNIRGAVSNDAMQHLESQLSSVRQSIFAFMDQTPSWTMKNAMWWRQKSERI